LRPRHARNVERIVLAGKLRPGIVAAVILRAWPPVVLLGAALAAQSDPPSLQSGYDGGFYLRTADGRNEVVLEGLFQAGLNVHQRAARVSEFDLRRMRPELAGRFGDAWRFRVEPKFTESDVELEEAWLGVDLAQRDALLMVGRMKAPFGLEEVRSRRHIDFPRFSILNQLVPAEDHGVFVNGNAGSGVFEYGLAVYNGTGASDTTSSKDIAARAGLRPIGDLHVGAAATWGRQRADLGGRSIRNAFDQPVIDFSTGARLDGERLRAGLELAWFSGPFLVQSEWLWVRQDMRQSGFAADIDFTGGYVSASYVLTGEERRGWKGVRPETPFDPLTLSGSGAWVLALRASELRSDPVLAGGGFTAPGRFTEHIRSLSLGLNWIPNDHVIVRHAWVQSFYSDDVLLGGELHGDEGALMIEWQVHF
jgi:phosphate-selective porin OprO/OprP